MTNESLVQRAINVQKFAAHIRYNELEEAKAVFESLNEHARLDALAEVPPPAALHFQRWLQTSSPDPVAVARITENLKKRAVENAKQTIRRTDSENGTKELRIHDKDHTPSWKRPGNPGTASLRAAAHVNAEWLTLDMAEYSLPRDGKPVSRETMFTLERAAAIALRDLLNETFK